MLMSLGQFVFSLTTIAYQELQRQTTWRHPSTSRVGARPARQFLGPGEDSITLSGVLAIELSGGTTSIDELRTMGDTGKAWPMVDGTGIVYGQFVIESLGVTASYLLPNGKPRRVEFQLKLERVDDAATDAIGEAKPAANSSDTTTVNAQG
jgi:phage protein U